jgi:hypothetical protein
MTKKQKLSLLKKDTWVKLNCNKDYDEYSGIYFILSDAYKSDTINGEETDKLKILDTYFITGNIKIQLSLEWFINNMSEWEIMLL